MIRSRVYYQEFSPSLSKHMEVSSELIVLTVSPQGLNGKSKTVGTTKDRLRGRKGKKWGATSNSQLMCLTPKLETKNESRSGIVKSTWVSNSPGVRQPTQRETIYAQQSFLVELLCQKQNETSGRKSSCMGKQKNKRRIKSESVAGGA